MSNPLIFVSDGRTLPYVPVTIAALEAIRVRVPARRAAYARSLYIALLEIANDARGDRAATSRKALGERAGCSRDLISDLTPMLVAAGVVKVEERYHGSERVENEWRIVEPETPDPRGYEPRGVEADSHGGSGSQPQPARASDAENLEEHLEEHPPLAVAEAPRVIARRVFAYWQQKCGHPTARYTSDRRSKIEARLRDGYTEADLRQAVDGAARDPYINDAGKKFDDIELICRAGSKTEAFIAKAAAPNTPSDSTDFDRYDIAAARKRAAGLEAA